MKTLTAHIDSWWKALSVLVAAVAIGVTAGVTLTAFLGLPANVASNTTRIVALETSTDAARLEREEISEGIERLQCLWLADRRNTPIEDCL